MSERVSHEVHAVALGGRLQGAHPCGRDPVSITDNRYVEVVIDPQIPGRTPRARWRKTMDRLHAVP